MLEVRMADPDRAQSVRAAVEQAGADQVTGPFYRLRDDSAARRAARQQAVGKARVEADDYAGALDMRVVRIVRVSERVAPYGDPEEMETVYASMGLGASPTKQIETTARIAMDFALAPR